MCLNFSDFQCEESIDRVLWLWFPGCSGSSLHPTEILAHRPTAEVATSLSWPCEVWRPEQAILLHRPSHHVCVLHALLSPNLHQVGSHYKHLIAMPFPISWEFQVQSAIRVLVLSHSNASSCSYSPQRPACNANCFRDIVLFRETWNLKFRLRCSVITEIVWFSWTKPSSAEWWMGEQCKNWLS